MPNLNPASLPQRERKATYIVISALLLILGVYNVIDPEIVPAVLDTIGNLLGIGALIGVALPNVPKADK